MKKRNWNLTLCGALAITLVISSSLHATTYFVKDNGGNDANTGLDFDNAFKTLDQALDVVGDWDAIWVATGTYTPTSNYFRLNDNVAIYGGFAGTEAFGTFDLDDRDFDANETVLDGQNSKAKVVYATNVDEYAVLDGFTITGATQCAIRNDGFASPTFQNLIVENNNGSYPGAGLFNTYFCNPSVSDCIFRNNTSLDRGGAVCNSEQCNATFTRCLFQNNSSNQEGGAMQNEYDSHPMLVDCQFTNNSTPSGGNGGAIYHTVDRVDASESMILKHCTFNSNRAGPEVATSNQTGSGGAVYLLNRGCPSIQFLDCEFVGNTANGSGGAVLIESAHNGDVCHATFASCVFDGCSALAYPDQARDGGAIYSYGVTTLINCVLTGNEAG